MGARATATAMYYEPSIRAGVNLDGLADEPVLSHGLDQPLGYKADVKARAKDSIQDKKESVMGVASSAKERLVGAGQTVGDAAPDSEQVKQQARQERRPGQSPRARRGRAGGRLSRRHVDPVHACGGREARRDLR